MNGWREVRAVARLDLGEVLRSRWLLLCGATYAVLGGAFVLVGLRESTVLGFTGMSRVLLSLSHALLLVLPLLAISATCQVINRAREDGTLELLFAQPLSRGAYFAGVTLTRYLVLLAPLVVLLIALTALGIRTSEGNVWPFVLRAVAVSASLLWASAGAGLAISTFTRNQAKAMVYGLVLWAGAAALLDFALVGLMLQWRLNPRLVFVLAAANPVEAARLALLSGVQPDLQTLGPVGFYLATRLGARALLAVGLLWPAVLGSTCWALAFRAFRRGDVV
jgi:ABC-2 type transport system permease protein